MEAATSFVLQNRIQPQALFDRPRACRRPLQPEGLYRGSYSHKGLYIQKQGCCRHRGPYSQKQGCCRHKGLYSQKQGSCRHRGLYSQKRGSYSHRVVANTDCFTINWDMLSTTRENHLNPQNGSRLFSLSSFHFHFVFENPKQKAAVRWNCSFWLLARCAYRF